MTPDIAPASARKPSDVLEAAADLIEPEGAWLNNGSFADKRASKGQDLWGDDEGADCFCARGAIQAACGSHLDADVAPAERYLARAYGGSRTSIARWNDNEATQAQVVTALLKAAALARSEGQ